MSALAQLQVSNNNSAHAILLNREYNTTLQSRAQSLPGSVSGWGAGKNSGITELIQFFWLAIGENNEMTEVSNNGNR
jgi:hypothetical protein